MINTGREEVESLTAQVEALRRHVNGLVARLEESDRQRAALYHQLTGESLPLMDRRGLYR